MLRAIAEINACDNQFAPEWIAPFNAVIPGPSSLDEHRPRTPLWRSRPRYGREGAEALRQAHVCVVGIGGVGSWAAEALARTGIGRITLIDLDMVAESNTSRQIHALRRHLRQGEGRCHGRADSRHQSGL
ncbi:MAG: ThiF family adenylyltransferase [Chromatiales bacterium]|nr:ThiF family adenylyltransferase [Chromatiales bacterium]